MASHRKDRVAEEMKKELSDIIRNQMKEPRVKGLISVTDVEVSRDISSATVYVSTLGDAEELKDILKAIKQASGFIRSELAGRMRLWTIPEMNFKEDLSIQTGARINELLNQQLGQDSAAAQGRDGEEA
jgi:ribosome-binding factor A